jgi:hypothetical protein
MQAPNNTQTTTPPQNTQHTTIRANCKNRVSQPSVPAIVTISQVNQSVIQLQLTPVNHTTTTNDLIDLTAEMSHNNTLIP